MKILLTTLNSKYIHSNLALKYLFAVCHEMREKISLREFTINNEDDYILGELLRGEYGVICFSCYIWNIERILNLSDTVRKARPDTKIVLGGPEVTHRAIEILSKYRSVDFILTGEGEYNFPKLLDVILNRNAGRSLDEIRGLVYRRDTKICVNPSSFEVDFRQVPFPYHTLISEADKIIYYESSRGCPYNCSYCLSSIDKGIRSLPVERVKQDLSYFIHKKAEQVKFVDRTFNYDIERACEIFSYLINIDNGITNFHFELCGELMDEVMFGILQTARPGLFQFEIGVQSTNPKTLNAINRKADFAKLSENVERLKKIGSFHLHLDLIAGLPYEDYNSFRQSFNDVYKLLPDQLQLGFLKLLPGTAIRDNADEHSYIYRDNAPYEVISNKYISADGLVRLKMVENILNLYYNRGGFNKTLKFATEELWDESFDFYEEFANFYYLKGFHHKSHKKEDLYRIFRLYGWWKDRSVPGTGIKTEQLLFHDMNLTLNPETVKKFESKGWEIR